jgi:hypothetical protein
MRAGKLIAAVATLMCWVVTPSAAHAVSIPVPEAATDAVEQVESTVTAPAPSVPATLPEPSERHPVHEAVAPVAESAAPVADSAAASLPAAAAAAPQSRLEEHARERASHISASASAGRMSSERVAHGHRLEGGARRPSSEHAARTHRPAAFVHTVSLAPRAADAPAVDLAPAGGAPAAAASGSAAGSFFFGGGCALVVASLLLAGPHLRRRLSLPPAMCRPAAFRVVLERPG